MLALIDRPMELLGAGAGAAAPLLAAVSVEATDILGGEGWLTNSIFVAVIVMVLVLGFMRRATRDMKLVPDRRQNLVEFVVEFLYKQVEGIVGRKFAPKAFPLLATLFIFILVSNWLGLVPGVGTIGWGHHVGPLSVTHIDKPLLRPATADLNMTLGMALFFMLAWTVVVIRDVGIGGFLKHTFTMPPGLEGSLPFKVFLGIIFLLVGAIEVISIAFRPVSLSLRLFGNIYAGESLLHAMGTLGDKWGPLASFLASVLIPLPFYFMELLVGLLQAVVFALLCAVYVQLVTSHSDHAEEGHH
jgi:F-type H+-transporting ATPase subunit a